MVKDKEIDMKRTVYHFLFGGQSFAGRIGYHVGRYGRRVIALFTILSTVALWTLALNGHITW
jgi:cytochrome c-type biogenesis protein CcmH/NrfF